VIQHENAEVLFQWGSTLCPQLIKRVVTFTFYLEFLKLSSSISLFVQIKE